MTDTPRHDILNLTTFKKEFDFYLSAFLKEKISQLQQKTTNDTLRSLINYTETLAQSGGKRIRPYMAYLGYLIAGGTDIQKILKTTVALELFHIFALIHDDIIDEGEQRHGIATTHVYTKTLLQNRTGNTTHNALSQAILLGDLVFNWSHQILFTEASPSREKILEIFNEMVEETVIGQMLDVDAMTQAIVSDVDIALRDELKTSRYTFIHPLKIGATLATTESSYTKFFTELGSALGSAYQIQDDLLDIIGDPQKTGKRILRDIQDGQHSFMSLYIRNNGTEEQKKKLLSFTRKELSTQEQQEAVSLFIESGAVAYAQKIFAQKISDAENSVAKTNLETHYKQAFIAIIDLLNKRNH